MSPRPQLVKAHLTSTVTVTLKWTSVSRASTGVLIKGLPVQTTITGSEASMDSLDINTLNGKDSVLVAREVGALINPVVDLGPGQ